MQPPPSHIPLIPSWIHTISTTVSILSSSYHTHRRASDCHMMCQPTAHVGETLLCGDRSAVENEKVWIEYYRLRDLSFSSEQYFIIQGCTGLKPGGKYQPHEASHDYEVLICYFAAIWPGLSLGHTEVRFETIP